MKYLFTVSILFLIGTSCAQSHSHTSIVTSNANLNSPVVVGAQKTDKYLPLLKDKKVAIVANQTSVIGKVHIVDSLLKLKVNIVKVFGPEHGFRGIADAGEKVSTSVDAKTKLPVISLYGSNKKPTADQLKDVDVIIFDIQDVGARFYTYISTMTYVMEACAENNKEVIILDRPNPNGHYVDGPVLKSEFKSFVGLHPVPIVHGMTVGEYAQMINEEGWLENKVKAKLTIIPCDGYDHTTRYILPINPSPNLNTKESIIYYPTICLFEGTVMSVGRGTDRPFTYVGHPNLVVDAAEFTPSPKPGSKDPLFNGIKCYGVDLNEYAMKSGDDFSGIRINLLIETYNVFKEKDKFFTDFFTTLIGNKEVEADIKAGKSADEIKAKWSKDVDAFKKIRKKYLLYSDFE